MTGGGNTGKRYEARKDLRAYDNPKAGRNPLYGDKCYMKSLECKYNMSEEELREWANSGKHERSS